MSDQFDFSRIVRLLRGDLIRVYRAAGIAAAAVVVLMVLQALIFQPFETDRIAVYAGVLLMLCFVGGPIVASRAFVELHDKEQNTAYLLLPASSAEKVLVRLVLVTVILLPALVLLVTATSWLVLALKAILFGVVERPFVPDVILEGWLIGGFITHQSLFLLGAAWFRKQHFVKTGLAIGLLSTAMAWFLILAVRILVPDLGAAIAVIGMNPAPLIVRALDSYSGFGWFAAVLFYAALPAFCWVVAWLRVRETQVSYGV